MNWETIEHICAAVGAVSAAIIGIVNMSRIRTLHILINSGLAERITDAVLRGRQQERDSHMIVVEGVPKPPENR